jgi:segregation and condensation protein B
MAKRKRGSGAEAAPPAVTESAVPTADEVTAPEGDQPADVATAEGPEGAQRATDRPFDDAAPADTAAADAANGESLEVTTDVVEAGADVVEAGAEPATIAEAQDTDANVLELVPPGEASAADGEASAAEGEATEDPGPLPGGQLETVIESLLFASDRPLTLADLRRLTGERDGKRIGQAVEALTARRAEAGVQVVGVAGGWQLRTNPVSAPWVGKLLAARPVRLSRAMLETVSIVAYRQPITRPEIDEIRGVDCGPVLKTLLERGLIRIIGKKEEVGRPMLYGTTPEFLRIFSLKDLAELPTLRQFHELSAEHQAKVEAEHGTPAVDTSAPLAPAAPLVSGEASEGGLGGDGEGDDGLLEQLERASEVAERAAGPLTPDPPPSAGPAADPAATRS